MSDKATSFKQRLEELEGIVEWFESEEVDIDQALENFRRGMEIASELEAWLDEAENTVHEIAREYSGEEPDQAGENNDAGHEDA